MQVFTATINQMMLLFSLIALGYVLRAGNFLPTNTAAVLSQLETKVLIPCMVFNTFSRYFTVDNISQKLDCVVVGFAVTAASALIGMLLARWFAPKGYPRKIYTYAFAVANFSFMGNALVLGLFGESVLFDYLIYTLPLSLFTYSYCGSALNPNSTAGFSLKLLFNPIYVAMIVGAAVGLTGISLPGFLTSAASSAAACMSPLAMLLAGFVIGNYNLKKLAGFKKIYLVSLLRLIVIPLFFVAVLKLLGVRQEMMMLTLCATAMPLGMNTVVYPAAYGEDTTTGASMVLISQVMSVITIPVMFMLFL